MRCRKYLRFVVEGKIYQFAALPFGLSTAPYAFTKLVKSVAAFAHLKGVLVHQYLDDWLLRAADKASSEIITAWLLSWMIALGFKVNFIKSDLNPEQRKFFLGIFIDLIQFKASPSKDRVLRCHQVIKQFQDNISLPAIHWQRTIGHLVSLSKIVPLAGVMLRPFQRDLISQWSP